LRLTVLPPAASFMLAPLLSRVFRRAKLTPEPGDRRAKLTP
jgi:hypothetical protein